MAELIRYTPRIFQNIVAIYWDGDLSNITDIQRWVGFRNMIITIDPLDKGNTLVIKHKDDDIIVPEGSYIFKSGDYHRISQLQIASKEDFESMYMPASEIFNEVSPIR